MSRFFKGALFAALCAVAIGGAGGSTASATPAPVGFTCLNRSSDGFNGCWLDGQPAKPRASVVNYSTCDWVAVTFDGTTPINRHGVTRTNAIAAHLVSNYIYPPGQLTPWLTAGRAAYLPGTVREDFGMVYVYLGRPNSYAHVWATGGNQGCQFS